MLLMKKDMGGAANVLGLAHAIIAAGLKVRLRVLIPVVENSIAGSAFRPGDILPSRSGQTVEIGNTDAEGRLILGDALSLADEEAPELILDMATLTGAARTALGPDLPALYSTDDRLARELMAAGLAADDPLWQMPLWTPYETMLSSKIADMNHVSHGAFAGSITAALFLKRFVKQAKAWVHLDIFAWAPEARPGRPFGGTDQGIRSVYGVLKKRYS
jgi:leucyl aminopeptidase